ncbi:plastocyanin/azurin family copper-binding protein [Halovivax ruber]|nr:plastocyanin/azurin family copper-binding protein [Halovivax ruber]
MVSRTPSSRRKTLKRIGAAMGIAWLAGCSDGGGPEDDGNGDGTNGDTGTDENETVGGGDNESDGGENETDGNETAGNESEGNESDTGGEGASGAIEPGTSIEFNGQTTAWVGIAPDSIADEENPPLTLQSGETYEIGWSEGDGAGHNIEIRDSNDEVINDLSTEVVSEPGDDQWLEFEASDEMAQYVCQPHQTTMVGEISVE